MTQADHVVAVLAANGRDVPVSTVERQLGGLGGLSEEAATDALLLTYGIGSDQRPLPGFEPDRTTRQLVTHLLSGSRSTLAFVALAAVIGLVPAIAVPLLIRLFVDRYIVAQDPTWGVAVLLGLVAAAVVATAVVYLQYSVLRRLTLQMSRVGQIGFTWRTLTMGIPDLQAFGAGDLVARRTALQRVAFQGGALLPMALVNSVTVFVYVVMIFILDLIMGVASIIIVVVALVVTQIVLKHRKEAQRLFDDERVALSGYTADVVGAMDSVKAAAWEQFAFARWSARRTRTADAQTQLGVANQFVTLVPLLAQTVGLGTFLAIGVAQVFVGTVSLGTVVAAQAYMVSLLATVGVLAFVGVLRQLLSSAAHQFSPVMQSPLDPEMLSIESRTEERLTGRISLHEVTFGYDTDVPPLLSGLSLEVDAGRRVALVGPSGSGKTTLAKLVVGELRPWSGFVALDGVPRLAVPRSTRVRDIAYVPQTSVLFPGTIRDNLTLWDDDVDEDALERAARDACIEATILGRPGAFFHVITSSDGGFSGGEMQRLAIARALVGDPRILVLDEATSALDPVVEADVEGNLRRRGITTLVVAHRLSTIRDADEILVVDEGRIVQQGSFETLSREGLFAELVHG